MGIKKSRILKIYVKLHYPRASLALGAVCYTRRFDVSTFRRFDTFDVSTFRRFDTFDVSTFRHFRRFDVSTLSTCRHLRCFWVAAAIWLLRLLYGCHSCIMAAAGCCSCYMVAAAVIWLLQLTIELFDMPVRSHLFVCVCV